MSLLTLSVLLALGAEAWADDVARYGEPEYLHFDSGLQVVLQAASSGQTVSVFAQLDAGWIADPPEARGVAHITEHLVFRRPVGTGTLWSDRRARGCILGATTHPDATRYQWTCPSTEVDAVTEDLLQLLTDPLEGVSSDVVSIEAGIIDQESHERENLGSMVSRAMFANLLPEDHPVHANLGEPDFGAPALGLEAAIRFVAEQYTLDRFTVGIAGAFDAVAVRAALVSRFGAPVDRPPTARSRQQAPESTLQSRTPSATDLSYPITNPQIVVGWNLPSGTGDNTTIGLAAKHLAGALQEKLVDEVDTASTVLDVTCLLNDHPEAAALLCFVSLQPDTDLNDAQRWVSMGLLSLWKSDSRKALRADLAEAAQRAPREVLNSLSAPGARARSQVFAVDAGRDPRTVEEAMRDARSWSPAGFEKLAARLFRPENAAWVHVQPGFQPRERAVVALPTPLAPSAPVTVLAQPLELSSMAATWDVLDNGVNIVAIRQEESPMVMASVRVPSGVASQPFGLAGIADWLTLAIPPIEKSGVERGEWTGQTHSEVYAYGPPPRPGQRAPDRLRDRSAADPAPLGLPGGAGGERRQQCQLAGAAGDRPGALYSADAPGCGRAGCAPEGHPR